MPEPEHFLAPVLVPLERSQLPYMITGGAAATIYGEPRVTLDVDLVFSDSQIDRKIIVGWGEKLGVSEIWKLVLEEQS